MQVCKRSETDRITDLLQVYLRNVYSKNIDFVPFYTFYVCLSDRTVVSLFFDQKEKTIPASAEIAIKTSGWNFFVCSTTLVKSQITTARMIAFH